jgi:hypothetical protein
VLWWHNKSKDIDALINIKSGMSKGDVLLMGPPGSGKSTLSKPVDVVRLQESYGILLIILTFSLHDL